MDWEIDDLGNLTDTELEELELCDGMGPEVE